VYDIIYDMKKYIYIIGIILVIIASCALYIGKNRIDTVNNHMLTQSVLSTLSPTPTITIIATKSVSTPTVSEVTPTTMQNTCNDLLVLVDKTHALPESYVPPDLVYLNKYNIPVTSNSLEARELIVGNLQKLFTAADAAHINLTVVSPYRSYQSQSEVYNSYVSQYGVASANQFSAIPGHSQHQLGTAIDFSTSSLGGQLEQSFAGTKAGTWLLANAYLYGFYLSYPEGSENVTGYEYEPWHFRYIGVSSAAALKSSGLIMQTYLEKYGVMPNC